MNYQSQKPATQFLLSPTGLPRYSSTFQQNQPEQQKILRRHTSTRFGAFTDSLDILLPTVVLNLPPSSTRSLTASSISSYASQLPTTLRQMDSGNEQSRQTSSTSASTAITGKTAREHSYLLPNLPTIPHLPPPMVTLPTEACIGCTHPQYTSIMTTNSPPPPRKND